MGDDEIEKTYKGDWGAAKLHADGSVTAENETAKVEMDGEGSTRVKLEKITKVTIDNITDVVSHTIKIDTSATSHHVVYRSGGEVRLSYRPDGRLLEFSGKGITFNVSKEGVITLIEKAS
jgi:hypothetical protein